MKKNFRTTLNIYTPTTKQSNKNTPIVDKNGEVIYYAKTENSEDDISIYYQFPFVLKEDGTLWYEANMYLLWKIKNNPSLDYKTLKIHASSLQDYILFCQRESIDWSIAKKITRRPNWKYRRHLDEKVANGEMTPNTLKKLIRPNTSFYQYLMNIRGMKFDVKLFSVIKTTIYKSDRYGKGFKKEIDVIDINQIKTSKNEFDRIIVDEGNRVTPLSDKEQKILFDTLHKLNNPEMKLAFLFSTVTGARAETVFTLRLKHFVKSLPKDFSSHEILRWNRDVEKKDLKKVAFAVGPGTDIDTKKNKRYNIKLHIKMKEAIITYIISKRAYNRRSKAHSQLNELDQYVFLTKCGNPYYMASTDINKEQYKYKEPPNGGTLNTFVSATLKPKMKELKCFFPFHFHNLRATFAINYLKINQPLVEQGKLTQIQLLTNLQKLMGHESIETTMKYLEYHNLWKEIAQGQDLHEEKLLSWI